MSEARTVLGNPDAVAFLEPLGLSGAEAGLVLGSGWGRFVDSTDVLVQVPFEEIPGFGASTVAGHAGRLVRGRADGVDYLAMQGRLHLYEGHSLSRIGSAVAVMAELGVRELVVTCAVGGVRQEYEVGDLVVIRDTINFMLESPLRGVDEPVDGATISPRLLDVARNAAREAGIPLQEGVLFASKGPSYETPAEVRMARSLGGDLVGMSTAPELIAAAGLGMEAMAVACVTNPAPGVSPGRSVTHEEVIEAMETRASQLAALLVALLRALDRTRPARVE